MNEVLGVKSLRVRWVGLQPVETPWVSLVYILLVEIFEAELKIMTSSWYAMYHRTSCCPVSGSAMQAVAPTSVHHICVRVYVARMIVTDCCAFHNQHGVLWRISSRDGKLRKVMQRPGPGSGKDELDDHPRGGNRRCRTSENAM